TSAAGGRVGRGGGGGLGGGGPRRATRPPAAPPAQTAESGGVGSWQDILTPYVQDRWEYARLGVNYRTPAEIMDVAAEVPRAAGVPGFEPPSSVRSTGVRPWARRVDDLAAAVAEAVSADAVFGGGVSADAGSGDAVSAGVGSGDAVSGDAVSEGRAAVGRLAVIAPRELHAALAGKLPDVPPPGSGVDLTRPVVLLDPREAKGLEFDTVLVVEPALYGTSDLYVALTRATQRLGILHTGPLPSALRPLHQPTR
ncbi:hypothetical protein ACFWJH_10535, partial [Streptomyces lasiicapitis]